jgi:hypothetical protein
VFDAETESAETARILFPAYSAYTVQFAGVVIPQQMSDCLLAIGEVPSGRIPPLTPYMILNLGWEAEPAYLTMN